MTFIGYFSRVTWTYLLYNKNEVYGCFQPFHKVIETQFDAKICVIQSDNGREYLEMNFQEYLMKNGIVRITCVNIPQQNGIAERKNRNLLEVARLLMFTEGAAKQYWGDAVLTAVHLINGVPSSVLGFRSPVSLLPPSALVIDLPLRIFGCSCYVHIHDKQKILEP